jgi:hypothetical protein
MHFRSKLTIVQDEADWVELQTQTGKRFKVDKQDLHIFKEYLVRVRDYVFLRKNKNGKEKPLHRVILQAPPELLVDHKNHLITDNRRSNIRLATNKQNSWNSRPRRSNRGDYKGVCLNKKTGKYVARITIGHFDTEQEAAEAYDSAAKHFHKEFAWLNFPEKF